MQRIILQICFSIICFQEVCCSVSRRNLLPFSNLRRQTEPFPEQQCVFEKFDEHFIGDNNSQFVAECRAVISSIGLGATDLSDEQTDEEQASIDQTFEQLCNPDCGDFILAASVDCGYVNASDIQPTKAFCRSNTNEDICYEFFIDYIDYFDIEINCFLDYYASGTCECQSELKTIVDDLGCCIDPYHQSIINEFAFNLQEIYDVCDVDLPTGCTPNNTNGAH